MKRIIGIMVLVLVMSGILVYSEEASTSRTWTKSDVVATDGTGNSYQIYTFEDQAVYIQLNKAFVYSGEGKIIGLVDKEKNIHIYGEGYLEGSVGPISNRFEGIGDIPSFSSYNTPLPDPPISVEESTPSPSLPPQFPENRAESIASRFGFNTDVTRDSQRTSGSYSYKQSKEILHFLPDGRVSVFNTQTKTSTDYDTYHGFIAAKYGFTNPEETGGGALKGGTTSYSKEKSFLHFYPDGSERIVRRSGDQEFYRMDISSEGEITVVFDDDFVRTLGRNMGGYSEHHTLVDSLYQDGLLDKTEYDLIKIQGKSVLDAIETIRSRLEFPARPAGAPAEGAPPKPAPPTQPTPQQRELATLWEIELTEGMTSEQLAEKIKKKREAAEVILNPPKPGTDTENYPFHLDQAVGVLGIQSGGLFVDPETGAQAVIERKPDGLYEVKSRRDRPESVPLGATWQKPRKDSAGNKIEGHYKDENGNAWDISGERDWVHTNDFDTWWAKHGFWSEKLFENARPLLQTAWATLGRFGEWRGISQAIAPEWTKSWTTASDSFFGRQINVVDAVPRAICESDDARSSDIEGENSLFIEGAGGTYQFVAALQAERSNGQTPILCNDDPEIKEEDRCPGELVCKDQLCYDNEDAEKPEAGYFYKIIWGVTAPQDQAYTPYIDEDGTSVKFNLKFKGASDWLYEREDGSAGDEVIELNNGAKDQGVVLDYSQVIHDEACIIFNEKYRPEDRSGEVIDREFCVTIKVAAPGAVEFETEDAEEKKPSATVSSGRVRGRSIFERS